MTVLDERYELTEPLGSGGMAEVWRARDTRLERDVALKLFPEALAGDPSRRRRIEREARALAAVSHPGIVTVYDYGETEGGAGGTRPFIVMELVDGPDLHHHLLEHGPFSSEELRDIMSDILAALDGAHGLGIVHGDIKPSNVFVGSQGAKIGDFGVARILDQETGNTTVAATPSYAAPEVLKGERPTALSDIYSAGCLAFHLLTGRPPYEGSNAWEIAGKHMEAHVPHVRDVRPEIGPDLDDAIHRAMDKNPRKRFGSAADLALAFSRTRDDATVPVAAPPAAVSGPEQTEAIGVRADLGRVALLGPLEPLWAKLSQTVRRPRALAIGGGAVLLLFGLVGLLSGAGGSVVVPDVRGQLIPDAVTTLQEQGLVVSDVSFHPITDGEPGRVIDTVPRSGTEVERDGEVHLIAGAEAAQPATPTPAVEDDNDDDDDEDDDGPPRGRGQGRG